MFLHVSNRAFCSKSPISMGRNDRLKRGKLLSLIGHIRNKKDSFQYHCMDIQVAAFFQTLDLFSDSHSSTT